MARDPRVTCLVEDGDDYFELRGVQVTGWCACIDEPADVLEIGRLIAAGIPACPPTALEEYVATPAASGSATWSQPAADQLMGPPQAAHMSSSVVGISTVFTSV